MSPSVGPEGQDFSEDQKSEKAFGERELKPFMPFTVQGLDLSPIPP